MTDSARRTSRADLAGEVARLQARLQEAEATLDAISTHGVDAFLVHRDAEAQVLVLDGVDRPYRLLIERMMQAAVTVSADGTILYANARLAELLCIPYSAVLGSRLADHVVAEDWPVLTRLLEAARAGDAEEELRLQCSESWVPVLATISRLPEPSTVYCLIITDLTQQKRLELERRRIGSEHAAAQATTAVLRETNRRKDEFLAMLAHELRGPLAPLRNGLEILGRIAGQDSQVREVREMMFRQTQSLVRLVDDLLDAARVTQGKIVLKTAVADIRDVVLRAVETARPLADAKRLNFEVSLPDGPIPAQVDETRLAQVVTNLLTNAVKFTPEQGTVSLSLEQPAEGEALIRVTDTGVGIDPAVLPSMFELFSQATTSMSRSEGGLGIGLHLARRLMEMHGGTLVGSSEGHGRGAEFVARLPLFPGRGLSLPEALRSPGRKAGRRVLIVDDNRDAAASLALLLSVMGHEVAEAHSGEAVGDLMESFRPDLVLLDIGLPGMDGYAVAGSLRANPSWRHVRLVAVSGYSSDEHRQRSRTAGFDDHIVKPLEIGRLQALLATLPA